MSLKEPFQERFRYWFTVELGRRLIFVLIIVIFPGKTVSSIGILPFNAFIIGIFNILYNDTDDDIWLSEAIQRNNSQCP